MYYGTTAELLFKIPGVPEDLGLRGAVFADAGSLWGVNSTAASVPGLAGNTPALRASVGMGLAWDSPLGNLRVDYAFPVAQAALRQDAGPQLRPEAVLSTHCSQRAQFLHPRTSHQRFFCGLTVLAAGLTRR